MSLTKVSYSMINGAAANILDFGADPTGFADSASAIQAALNANSSVYIPVGTYRITTELVLNADQHIFGDGRKSLIYTTTGSLNNGINMLMAYEKFNILIENIGVQNTGFGNAYPAAGTFTGMGIPVGLIGCTNGEVRKCYVYNGGGVLASPYTNQGSCGIYFSSSNNCRAIDNFVTSGQNGITIDQWYSTLAGGSKASFKNGYNLVSNNIFKNMAGRGLAIDDDLTQQGFNTFSDNIVSMCAYAGMSATFSTNLKIVNNQFDGQALAGHTQTSTGAACYYGMVSNGLSKAQITGNTFTTSLFCGIFGYDMTGSLIANNTITSSCVTNIDTIYPSAKGGIDITATASNILVDNQIIGNKIEMLGTTASMPGIYIESATTGAQHKDYLISNNIVLNFTGYGISVPTITTAKTARFSVCDNDIKVTNATPGTGGVYSNGVTYSKFTNNTIYGFVSGIIDANGLSNTWTGRIDYCGQGFVHTSLNSEYIALNFTNITNEAIYGSGTISGVTNGTNCTFTSVGYIKSGVSPAASSGLLLQIYATAAPTGATGQIAIGGVGDRIINSVPTVGQPKAWTCTTAGTPGTWVSEGNL